MTEEWDLANLKRFSIRERENLVKVDDFAQLDAGLRCIPTGQTFHPPIGLAFKQLINASIPCRPAPGTS